ncbi:small ribosomal subunit Rsm22 family protein [Actinomadura rugatobispora]|uniref:Small ribosomal subunit Rsm22 family protein n=1 Tax=Actinomadura rugatobispora TaxID=1994 RepID=A0ABW1AJN0_9ACTN
MSEGFAGDLLEAAEREIEGERGNLGRAYKELSDGYRGGGATPDDAALSRDHVLAYLAARLPATYAVSEETLGAIAAERPEWEPRSVLDLGAGPGTSTWAAVATFPSLESAVLVERSSSMIQVGRRLAERSDSAALRSGSWRRGGVVGAELPAADLVVASYVLNELPSGQVDEAVAQWWDAARGELLIIEPGTPAGFARISQARTRLLASGATITAPCPTDFACPMAADDWCHFGRRISRTALHRWVKSGTLGFEDEKYSYVVASRQEPVVSGPRVLRAPQVRSGHIRLTVCAAPETQDVVVARSKRDAYRWAKRARWGDAMPLEFS